MSGLEIANGYSELLNPEEQKGRLIRDNEERLRLGKESFPLDEAFLDAISSIPGPVAGSPSASTGSSWRFSARRASQKCCPTASPSAHRTFRPLVYCRQNLYYSAHARSRCEFCQERHGARSKKGNRAARGLFCGKVKRR